jgi:hypothetical protein
MAFPPPPPPLPCFYSSADVDGKEGKKVTKNIFCREL